MVKTTYSRMRATLFNRLSLHADQSSFEEIDENIRDGVHIGGTNLWVLMLAIFIASIGLDVNSTAVIIGAMLISPLMGPIMGVGYGAGINDFILIKKALGNLIVSIFISLFTSTVYFLISPLSTMQSELLARTTPTIWDVLIALFGGLAGIIALTRKEKSNVIPGVAIATALMPPLCTAGYGLAHGSLEMFFGAIYLFLINCVFIALSTLMLVSYLDPPHKQFVSKELESKVKRHIYIVVLVTILPSIYLAYVLVDREVFNSRANEFINKELVFEKSFVAKQKISPAKKEIDLTLVGAMLDDVKVGELTRKLGAYRIPNAKLVFHQTVIKELDETSLRKSLLNEILTAHQVTDDVKGRQTLNLKEQKKIFDELVAQYPQIKKLAIAKVGEIQADQPQQFFVLLVNIKTKRALSREDLRKITAWLKVRTEVNQVKLAIENS